jgi:hypothetical protein
MENTIILSQTALRHKRQSAVRSTQSRCHGFQPSCTFDKVTFSAIAELLPSNRSATEPEFKVAKSFLPTFLTASIPNSDEVKSVFPDNDAGVAHITITAERYIICPATTYI